MALVNRKAGRGNPAALAEVLNLGDGLIGEMLDLRIVATTNAERIEAQAREIVEKLRGV